MKLLQLPARFFYIFFRLLLALAVKLFYRVSVEGKDNLRSLRGYLKEGSVIVALNHLSFDDAYIVGGLILSVAAKEVWQVIAPVSLKWWRTPLAGWVLRLLCLLGTKPLPVVQHYQRDLYSSQEVFHFLKILGREARRILVAKGGLILIHPEGTRSRNGTLQEPQSGIDSLVKIAGRKSTKVVIVPVALEPKGSFGRYINSWRRLTVHFGQGLSVKEVQERSKTEGISPGELIMEEIANLLPERFAPQAKKAEH